MHDRAALMEALVASAADGRIKLYLARTTLALRRDRHALFTRGAYVPLTAVGARADHVFAFARVHDGAAALTVVPRWCAALAADGSAPVGSGTWGDTRLVLPPELAALRFHDQLTGLDRGVAPAGSGSALPVADVLAVAPVALLVGGAGTL
jgi:(1->4)-alpha-D-glucan 1-alpha-D-glucosylmutase